MLSRRGNSDARRRRAFRASGAPRCGMRQTPHTPHRISLLLTHVAALSRSASRGNARPRSTSFPCGLRGGVAVPLPPAAGRLGRPVVSHLRASGVHRNTAGEWRDSQYRSHGQRRAHREEAERDARGAAEAAKRATTRNRGRGRNRSKPGTAAAGRHSGTAERDRCSRSWTGFLPACRRHASASVLPCCVVLC